MNRRTRLDIEAELIDCARQGSIKTWLVYRTNLNSKGIKVYLNRLIEKGLLEKMGKLYYSTDKGLEYMRLINQCQRFLK